MTAEASRSIQLFLWFGGILFTLLLISMIFPTSGHIQAMTLYKTVSRPTMDAIYISERYFAIAVKIFLFLLFFCIYTPRRLPAMIMVTLAISLIIVLGHNFFLPTLDMSKVMAGELPPFLPWHRWIYSSFNILRNIWSPWFIVLLFLVHVNQTITTNQAKWMYPGWGAISIATPLLGLHAYGFTFQHIDTKMIPLVVVIVSLFLWVWLCLKRIRCLATQSPAPQTGENQFAASFKFKYLMLIFGIATCFALCAQIIHSFVAAQYIALGTRLSSVGLLEVFSFFGMISIFLFTCWGVYVIGWFRSALMVPALLLVSGGLFFVAALLDSSPMTLVWYGITSQVILLGVSWSLFLTTKEMAYIPLSPLTKARGKSVIDFLLLSKFLFLGALFGLFDWISPESFNAHLLNLAFVYFAAILVWFFCLIKLKGYYNQALNVPVSSK